MERPSKQIITSTEELEEVFTKQYIPLFFRILKKNDKMCDLRQHFNKERLNPIDELVTLLRESISHVKDKMYTTWSIHNGYDWIEQYDFSRLNNNDLKQLYIISFGMFCNRYGDTFHFKGYYYDEYMQIKNNIIKDDLEWRG